LALSTERAVQKLAVIMFAARIFAHAVLKLAARSASREVGSAATVQTI